MLLSSCYIVVGECFVDMGLFDVADTVADIVGGAVGGVVAGSCGLMSLLLLLLSL